MDAEKQNELEERKQKFLDGYKELRDDTQIDIFFIPSFIPDGKGAFLTVVHQNLVDLKNQAIPSSPNDFL